MTVVRDSDCTAISPLVMGFPDPPIYGQGRPVFPRYPGKQETDYDRKMHLPSLLPLEEYDLIVVLFSGGKDSIAAYIRLLELGVPKRKIELWHHDVDGKHPTRRMDWPVTQNYVKAFAEAEQIKLRTSWRVNGFFGELYRIGASCPIEYEDDGKIKPCRQTEMQIESARLRDELCRVLSPEDQALLETYGRRMRFPAKSGDLSRRWCSAYLKIDVASTVLRNLEQTRQGIRILIVSGERRGESAGRARYNEMEVHRSNASARANRLVHLWRPVIDYTLRDVWESLRRHNITPHPCYSCGWNRCSCMCCIFSLPGHWAGIRELFPELYAAFREDEVRLGFTLDNKLSLDDYVGDVESCVYRGDLPALDQLVTGTFAPTDIHRAGRWEFPAGAFKGSAGGPC